MTTITKFHIRYLSADKYGEYVPNWKSAVEAEIIADTASEAKEILLGIIGYPPHGREWRVSVNKIIQEKVKTNYEPLIDEYLNV